MNALRNCLLIAICVSLFGCTSMRPVSLESRQVDNQPVSPNSILTVGDELRVTMRDESTIRLAFTSLNQTELNGTDIQTGQQVSLNVVDIKAIDRRERDATKTTLLVIAIIVGIAVIINFIASNLVVSGA